MSQCVRGALGSCKLYADIQYVRSRRHHAGSRVVAPTADSKIDEASGRRRKPCRMALLKAQVGSTASGGRVPLRLEGARGPKPPGIVPFSPSWSAKGAAALLSGLRPSGASSDAAGAEPESRGSWGRSGGGTTAWGDVLDSRGEGGPWP